jgi:hypothetical protein
MATSYVRRIRRRLVQSRNGEATTLPSKFSSLGPDISPYLHEAIERAKERDARRSWWQKLLDGDLRIER